MEAFLIIADIVIMGFLGFYLTLNRMGENPKGRALSILVALLTIAVYLFLS